MAKTGLCSVPGCIKRGVLRKSYCEPHYDRFMKYGTPYGGGTFRGVPLAWLKNRKCFKGEDCLIWPFALKGGGYGTVNVDGKDVRAHRVMCILAHGEPPSPDHEAAHSCGKGHEGCVNPRHLRWATRVENQSDRIDHGTHNRGERSVKAILCRDDVFEIRRLRGTATHATIAAKFGISASTVRSIYKGQSWSWLE